MATPPANRDEFEVALVCSLPLEYDAVSLLFDQFWDENGDPYGRAIGDPNTYATGRFGNFDVVLVLLPNTGKVSAASATASLRSSYPGLRLVILTGICGAVPSSDAGDEILLGDVIISKDVIQYDYGKQYPDNFIVKDTTEDSLGRPDKNIRSLVAVLETARERERIEERAALLLEKIQDAAAKKLRHLKADTYQYPGSASDKLFQASYRHKHYNSLQCLCAQCHEYSDPVCEESRLLACDVLECDEKYVIPRQRLGTNRQLEQQKTSEEARVPSVFIGRFGSSDTMLRSGEHRDLIAKHYGVLAFEMEGAGVWDELPCIIVKGVCNYADSHTNNHWQNFAAATAASVAKSLVERYTKTDKSAMIQTQKQLKDMMEDKESSECLKDLHQTDPRDDKTRIQRTKGNLLKDSYRWVLDHNDFKQWRDNPQYRLLWIKGDPGKGKTMLLCGIIDEIESSTTTMHCLSYFFCQATEIRLRNSIAVLRGLIYMIIIQRPLLISYVREKYDSSGKQLFNDGNAWEALSKILMAILNDTSLNDAILIVDALDECVEGLPLLLEFISQASGSSQAKWIVSSRNWPVIEENLDTAMQGVRLCLELNEASVSTAVHAYIKYQTQELTEKKGYDTTTQHAVEQHLTSNAHGTFLWVALVCQELRDPNVKKRHTLHKLETLYPPGLNSLYQRMLENIRDSLDADICRQILAIISIVYRPIKLAELDQLLDSDDNYDNDDLSDIIGSCGSFLTIRNNVVYFIHQSAKDFLLDKSSDQVLASGIGSQHHMIFSRSLGILIKTLHHDIYNLRLPGFPIEQVSRPNSDPLAPVAYSCIYWIDHFNDSKYLQSSKERSQSEETKDEGAILRFFELKCLFWLEALSLLRGLTEGVTAIQKLMKCIQAPRLIELLEDTNRFILFHKRAIESAPLQMYATALVFSPSQSKIRTHFVAEEPKWILTKPLMETCWSASLNILEGHTGDITAIAFSLDSSLIASGSEDKTIRLWRTKIGDSIQELKGHSQSIESVAFSNNSAFLASGSRDTTIRLWDVSTGKCMKELKGHTDRVHLIAFSFNSLLIASASNDKTILLWSTGTRSFIRKLKECDDIMSITFSQDSQRLASASTYATIKLWDVDTGSCIRAFDLPGGCDSATFSRDLELFTAVSKGTLRVWCIDTEELKRNFESKDNFVHSVAFSHNSSLVAKASEDGIISFWSVDTGRYVRMLKLDDTDIQSTAFSHDLSLVAVPWMGKTIRLWRTDVDSDAQVHENSRAPVTLITFSPNLTLVASASISNAEMDERFDHYQDFDYYVISLWCAETGRHIQKLYGNLKGVQSIAFSHDSIFLATASRRCVQIWRTDTGHHVQFLRSSANAVTFLHDSGFIAAAFDRRILFYRIDTDLRWRTDACESWQDAPDRRVSTSRHVTGQIASIAFSPGSELVALGLSDKTIQILDFITDAHVQTLRGHKGIVSSIAFSQDSTLVASAARDDSVRLWRVGTGECLQNIYVGAVSMNLSITSNNAQILTNFGDITIDTTSIVDAQIEARISGIGVRRDYSWITWNDNNILRLPAELGATHSAILGSTVAIGCKSGRTIIIRLSTEELSKLYDGVDNNGLA